jgi:hypothetical protein
MVLRLDEAGDEFPGTLGAEDPPPPHPARSIAASVAASKDERMDDLLSIWWRERCVERTRGARRLHWTSLRRA